MSDDLVVERVDDDLDENPPAENEDDEIGEASPPSQGIPLLDRNALSDLEQQAKRVADGLDLMLGNLTNSLHYMSAVAVQCIDAYQQSVNEVGQAVDHGMKAMYALIAKCEGIASKMEPIEKLAQQIQDIKQTLDVLERACK
ncbi:BLOC-1-related complex subunit 6-like [Oscarella lobularis]|uniref:BLOC-1-related complex subunit 6-like n=1 Tax=Oscarella lobularis TaxID=121494 RepID=UPI003313A6E8